MDLGPMIQPCLQAGFQLYLLLDSLSGPRTWLIPSVYQRVFLVTSCLLCLSVPPVGWCPIDEVPGSAAAPGLPAFNEQQTLAAPWQSSCITSPSNILQLRHFLRQRVSKIFINPLADCLPWTYPASLCKLLVNIWPKCRPKTDPQQMSECKCLAKSHKHLNGKITSRT